jgi:MFS family permease
MNNKQNLATVYAWTIWAIAALFYAYEFFSRVSPSVMVPQLMHVFNVQAASLSIISSSYYWIYVIMQIPAGLLVDRYDAGKIMAIAIALVALGSLLFASVDTVIMGCVARGLIGCGSAFAFVCSLKLITQWFPANRFAMLAGATQFLGYMGASLGGAPLANAVTYYGWRNSVLAAAIFGIILAFITWLVVRERNSKSVRTIQAFKITKKLTIWRILFKVARKPQTWFNGLYACFMMGPTSVFAALWGVPYLMNVDHLTKDIAAGAVSMVFFGVAFGSPFFGWFSDKLGLRRPPLIMAAFGALVVTSAILYLNHLPIAMLYMLCFLFGFFQSAHVLNFAVAHEINRPAITGAAISFTNMLTVIGGAIFQPLVGFFLVLGWDGLKNQGIAQYSISNYQHSLLILPIVQTLAFFIAIFILKETHCKPKHDPIAEEMCAQI